jgi:hypothetical protein
MRSSRGAKGTAKPPEDVPEPYDHGKNLARQSPSELGSNSLILRVYDVLMNDRRKLPVFLLILSIVCGLPDDDLKRIRQRQRTLNICGTQL